MMTNLFSSFDPSSSMLLPLNWVAAMIIIFYLTPSFWKIPSKKNMMILSVMKTLHKEFNMLIHSNKTGLTMLFISLFILVVINNFMGLFPYIFTSSSHMTMTLTLAFPLWLSFMIYGWVNNTMHMLAHLVPNGTPGALMPFMVLIESISNIIRPITLSVRLMANMVAGHLLMTLLGNQTALAENLILLSLIITQILLLTLESAVAIIQSYVFSVLSTLYSSEVSPH